MIGYIVLTNVNDLCKILRTIDLLVYEVTWIVPTLICFLSFLVLLISLHYDLEFSSYLHQVLYILEREFQELLCFA